MKGAGWLGAALVAILIFALSGAIGKFVGRSVTEDFSAGYNDGAMQKMLPGLIKKSAESLREQSPVRVDKITTMTGALSVNSEIIYLMSVDLDFKDLELAAAHRDLQLNNTTRICSDEKTRTLIEMGGTMSHLYTDSSGDQFKTTVSTCG